MESLSIESWRRNGKMTMKPKPLRRYRRLWCVNCSPKRQKLGFPKHVIKTQHELALTTYYPNVKYQCLHCHNKQTIRL